MLTDKPYVSLVAEPARHSDLSPTISADPAAPSETETASDSPIADGGDAIDTNSAQTPAPFPVIPRATDESGVGDESETEPDIAEQRPRWVKYMVRAMLGALAAMALLGALLAYVYFRANASEIHPQLALEHWTAVSDGRHNSNTDLIYWRGAFYLIHASSPWHFGSSDCRLRLHRSLDARSWEMLAEFRAGGGDDIRDPKFAAIGNRLYLYVLVNDSFMATPESTSMTWTEDGLHWAELREIEPKGWLFWRPKTRDNLTWYCPAYWHDHGKSILLKSNDGENWQEVSVIYEGDANDETDIEFLPDGRILATARLEIEPDKVLGHADAHTLLAVAAPPYTEWSRARSHVDRLDGPYLFRYQGEVYAVGRRNPDPNRFPTYTASVLGRKRTALYKVLPDKLIWLSDLPSAGDTSYAGVVTLGQDLFVSYYTSDITRDWPWLIGMVSPTEIRLAKVSLPSLAQVAHSSE